MKLKPSVVGMLLLGQIYSGQRDNQAMARAKSAYITAATLDPSNLLAHQGLLNTYTALEDYVSAEREKTILKQLTTGQL